MDEIDRKILALIQLFGRASYAELGAVVGLSVSTINERLKRLTASGAINGWSAVVSPKALGLKLTAFVSILVSGAEEEARLHAVLKLDPIVEEMHHVTGEWSYLVKLRLRDTDHLEEWLSRVLKPLPGIGRTHTVIALSTVKERAPIHTGTPP